MKECYFWFGLKGNPWLRNLFNYFWYCFNWFTRFHWFSPPWFRTMIIVYLYDPFSILDNLQYFMPYCDSLFHQNIDDFNEKTKRNWVVYCWEFLYFIIYYVFKINLVLILLHHICYAKGYLNIFFLCQQSVIFQITDLLLPWYFFINWHH